MAEPTRMRQVCSVVPRAERPLLRQCLFDLSRCTPKLWAGAWAPNWCIRIGRAKSRPTGWLVTVPSHLDRICVVVELYRSLKLGEIIPASWRVEELIELGSPGIETRLWYTLVRHVHHL